MKLRPIIFRGDMVRAILAGTKTQTRRIVKLREFDRSGTPGYDWTFRDREARWHDFRDADFLARKCPYGVPSDELWVRETFAKRLDKIDGTDSAKHYLQYKASYSGDLSDEYHEYSGWLSPILMPRWASRITLVVRSVRVERLSAVTEEDARAEGFCRTPAGTDDDGAHFDGLDARHVYIAAFRAMHKLAADADPWLWVVGFERKEAA